MIIVFKPSVQYTGTAFTQLLLCLGLTKKYGFIQLGIHWKPRKKIILQTKNRSIIVERYLTDYELISFIRLEMYDQMEEENCSSQDFLALVQTHIGEPDMLPNDKAEVLIRNFKTIIPVRDPLLSLISKHARFRNDSDNHYDYMVNGFVFMADLWSRKRNVFFLPIDLYSEKSAYDRESVIFELIDFLGIDYNNLDLNYLWKCYNWQAIGSWPQFKTSRHIKVDDDYVDLLNYAYWHGDEEYIDYEIPDSYPLLKSRKGELRPFLESLGYDNLIWWR